MVTIDDIKTHYKLDKLDNTSDANKPATVAMSNSLASKLTKTTFDTVNAMPGLPIWDVGMAFLPSLTECEIDGNGKVSKFTDAASGVQLVQTDTAKQPELKIDALGREFLRFDDDRLEIGGIKFDELAGSTGKTITLAFAIKVNKVEQSVTFSWLADGTGTYNDRDKLIVHAPWSDNKIYIACNSYTEGGLSTPAITTIANSIVTVLFELNETSAKIYVDGVLAVSKNNLTSGFVAGKVGHFAIGGIPSTDITNAEIRYAEMDFYAMFIYPRVLTDEEKARMFLYTKKYFKQLPSGA